MIKTFFVTKNESNYVTGWSLERQPDTIEIQADDSLFNMFFCVKVIDGVGQLDEKALTKLEADQARQDAVPSTDEQLLSVQLVAADLFEQNLQLQQQLIDTQIAMTELFESTL